MKNNKWWWVINPITIILVIVFIRDWWDSEHKISPRMKNGKDILFSNDSAYVIHFTIDSVYELEPEGKPERN